MRKYLIPAVILFSIIACNNDNKSPKPANSATGDGSTSDQSNSKTKHFRGALTKGMKGDSIFFDVNSEGTKVENLYFKGYWYCDGKLERQNAAGPEGSFTITDNKVDQHISEPPNGGATAWRFDLTATIDGNNASGTFRMNINNLGCNTGMLSWTATAD